LQSGLSRFYAEIQRLKHITDLATSPRPALFLLDELLSGTNSHDRRVGTEALLRSLLSRNTIGLITTHDLALTKIADALQGRARNMHFTDRYSDGQLYFDYTLTAGIADSTNALQLMRSIGLEV
jgi:DNA mismatch repair ATPase MutS